MAKNTFTDEQILILRQNPFTLRVTHNYISFTKEFKEIFIAEYNNGKTTRQILLDHGYDPEMFGTERIWGISHHIRKQFEKYGDVFERVPKDISTKHSKPLSDKDEIKQLRHEVDYMKQEIEFLKKISSIITTKK